MSANPSIPELAAMLFTKIKDAETAVSKTFAVDAPMRHALNQAMDATVMNIYDTLRCAIRSINAITELAQDCVKAKENPND